MTTKNKPHSPHSLESLVPPLDLCKQIPEGKFKFPVLVWDIINGEWCVTERQYADPATMLPAPTLQEILYKLRNLSIYNEIEWIANCKLDPETWLKTCKDPNPATAALKLWLELNSTHSIPSIPSIPTPEVKP